ncbi:hypothetical protein [Burkholderia sp. MBR-1]|uniref:hypothetical protein n=1 Tax=Burkholderia sp. MBR-1 TaxID=2732364 RepID=UPI0015EF279A|nr:hypothetical protein [Burkholderia sp. MBR-1]QMI49698.1 hypothetical protein MBR110_29890 [Burkholderia sp. MBR-1]
MNGLVLFSYHHSIVDIVLDTLVRGAVYRVLGAATRGHSLQATILIAVCVIGGVVITRKILRRP